MFCSACKSTVAAFRDFMVTNSTVSFLESVAVSVCSRSYSKEICTPLIGVQAEVMKKQGPVRFLNPDMVCGRRLGICASSYEKDDIEDYKARLFASKPDVIVNNEFIDTLYEEMKQDAKSPSEREKLRIAHLTDFHIDYMYQPGTKS